MRYDTKLKCFVFEVGEEVTIRPASELKVVRRRGDRAGVGLNDEMIESAGKKFKIMCRMRGYNGYYRYGLREIGFTWTEEFFVSPAYKVNKRISPFIMKVRHIVREMESDGLSASMPFKKVINTISLPGYVHEDVEMDVARCSAQERFILWEIATRDESSSVLFDVLQRLGVCNDENHWESYFLGF